MRLTEALAYVNDEVPSGYISYHLDMPSIRANKDVKSLKKAIKKRNKEESKLENQGKKNGTEDVDLFGDA